VPGIPWHLEKLQQKQLGKTEAATSLPSSPSPTSVGRAESPLLATDRSHQQPRRTGALISLLYPDRSVSFSNPEPTSFSICSYSLAVLFP